MIQLILSWVSLVHSGKYWRTFAKFPWAWEGNCKQTEVNMSQNFSKKQLNSWLVLTRNFKIAQRICQFWWSYHSNDFDFSHFGYKVTSHVIAGVRTSFSGNYLFILVMWLIYRQSLIKIYTDRCTTAQLIKYRILCYYTPHLFRVDKAGICIGGYFLTQPYPTSIVQCLSA